jgi:hypothetical protein
LWFQGDCNQLTHRCVVHRRFAITCADRGNFPLAFRLNNGGLLYNEDYGIRVECKSPPGTTGLYGRVTARTLDTATGVYKRGQGIQGATVVVNGTPLPDTTSGNGDWSLPTATGGPYTVEIIASGPVCANSQHCAPAKAVNVRVPVGGAIEVNTDLEEKFSSLTTVNAVYSTIFDYSEGRTIFHVLEVPNSARVGTATASSTPEGNCLAFDLLTSAAAGEGALAAINGTWFDPCTGKPQGYYREAGLYIESDVYTDGGWLPGPTSPVQGGRQYFREHPQYAPLAAAPGVSKTVLAMQGTQPMFTMTGLGPVQTFDISQSRETPSNFRESPSQVWALDSFGFPIWDKDRDGFSDITYAMQIANPPLVLNNVVIAGNGGRSRGPDLSWTDIYGQNDQAWSYTAVGVRNNGQTLVLVVSDGEGIMGGNGPSQNAVGHLFRDVLGAVDAIALDSGWSAEMVLRSSSGSMRRVNTLTGEDAGYENDPVTQIPPEAPGRFGAVANFLYVSQ